MNDNNQQRNSKEDDSSSDSFNDSSIDSSFSNDSNSEENYNYFFNNFAKRRSYRHSPKVKNTGEQMNMDQYKEIFKNFKLNKLVVISEKINQDVFDYTILTSLLNQGKIFTGYL